MVGARIELAAYAFQNILLLSINHKSVTLPTELHDL